MLVGIKSVSIRILTQAPRWLHGTVLPLHFGVASRLLGIREDAEGDVGVRDGENAGNQAQHRVRSGNLEPVPAQGACDGVGLERNQLTYEGGNEHFADDVAERLHPGQNRAPVLAA